MCFRSVELWRTVMEEHGDGGKLGFITEMGTLEATPINLGIFEWMKLPPARRAQRLPPQRHGVHSRIL